MRQQKQFQVGVRNETYNVEGIDLGSEVQYKISTACNYIMTIYKNDEGMWAANSDVQVMDRSLVDDIGSAIELKEV